MEAAGIEPETRGQLPIAGVGRELSALGPDASQVGQLEGLAVCPVCKGRTGPGPSETEPGRETSTTGAQLPRTEDSGDPDATDAVPRSPGQYVLAALPEDLRDLIEAWPQVPEGVRVAIASIVRATTP